MKIQFTSYCYDGGFRDEVIHFINSITFKELLTKIDSEYDITINRQIRDSIIVFSIGSIDFEREIITINKLEILG
jgi:hypothetical protein